MAFIVIHLIPVWENDFDSCNLFLFKIAELLHTGLYIDTEIKKIIVLEQMKNNRTEGEDNILALEKLSRLMKMKIPIK